MVNFPRSVVALATLMSPSVCLALGLGDVELKSYLGAPLHAEIALHNDRALDPQQILVSIASRKEFQRLGVNRDHFLNQLRFSLQTRDSGKQFLLVSSRDPVFEPFMDFIVDLRWAQGQLLKEYTLLLDPPTVAAAPISASQAPAAKTAAAVSSTPKAASPAPTQSSPSASQDSYLTRNGDSLWAIAKRLKPSSELSTRQTMRAIYEKNPQAFINQNINLLKSGARLALPSEEEVLGYPAKQSASFISEKISQGQAQSTSTTVTAPKPQTAASAPRPAPLENATQAAITPSEAEQPSAVPSEAPVQDQLRILTATDVGVVSSEEHQQLQAAQNELLEEKADLLKTILTQYEQLEDLKLEQERLNGEISRLQQSLAGGAAPSSATANSESTSTSPSNIIAEENLSTVQSELAAISNQESVSRPAFVASWVTSGLLFLCLIYLLISQRKNNNAQRADRDESREQTLAEISLAVAAKTPTKQNMSKSENLSQSQPKEAEIDIDLSALNEIDDLYAEDEVGTAASHKESEPGKTGSEFSDVARAANVYIAYGQLDEAKSLLSTALIEEPARTDLKMCLLEIYSKENDLEAFEALATEFEDVLDPNGLSKLNNMRKDLTAHAVLQETPMVDEDTDTGIDSLLSDEEKVGDGNVDLSFYPEQDLPHIDLDPPKAKKKS